MSEKKEHEKYYKPLREFLCKITGNPADLMQPLAVSLVDNYYIATVEMLCTQDPGVLAAIIPVTVLHHLLPFVRPVVRAEPTASKPSTSGLHDALTSAAHEFEVKFADTPINLEDGSFATKSKLQNLPVSDLKTVSELTGLAPPQSLAKSEVVTSLGEIFSECGASYQGESEAQHVLNSWATSSKIGLDTSTKGHTPWFLPKQNVQLQNGKRDEVPAFKASAKVDLILKNVPVGLELKVTPAAASGEKTIPASASGEMTTTTNDTALVAQMVTRVCVQLRVLGYLSRSVCVGSSGRAAWLVVASRPFDCREDKCVVRVFRLSFVDAALLFVAFDKQTLENYLTIDGPLLIRALQYLSIDPGVCRVHALWNKTCRVYRVTPGMELLAGSTRCVGVPCHAADVAETIAIKVVEDPEDFKREIRALKLLVPAYQERGLFHYGLGFFSSTHQEKLEKNIFSSPPARLSDFAFHSKVWWNFAETCPAVPDGMGCIFMWEGDTMLQRPLTDSWLSAVSGVSHNLEIAHSLGLCHADVRCPNVMQFQPSGDWLLIDWGLSCVLGEKIVVERAGARGERAGGRIKRLLYPVKGAAAARIETEWTPADDWAMLAHMPFAEWAKFPPREPESP